MQYVKHVQQVATLVKSQTQAELTAKWRNKEFLREAKYLGTLHGGQMQLKLGKMVIIIVCPPLETQKEASRAGRLFPEVGTVLYICSGWISARWPLEE